MCAGSFWPPACAGLSGEDLVDVELRPLTCPGALLVLARDQLADQAEGEELQAHDDEEHPEDQQRALSDCVAVDLDRCQVSEHRDAENSEQQAEPAEQMKRPVAVPTDEGDGQQVEEASEVALDAVSRAPVLARPVIHGQLCDSIAAVVGQDRDEAMELAVEA